MTAQDVIKAAMSLAKDAAEGRLDGSDLDAELTEHCRQLFGNVVGSGDPLWAAQIDVARQVLALGGIEAGELGEWTAVAAQRAQDDPISARSNHLQSDTSLTGAESSSETESQEPL